jgi:uncharacterized protein YjbI with pentapeptide repeats
MENLNVWKKDYPFEDITIKTPKALQGGTYCANLELDDEPIIIQTPKCKTKNGIHKTAKQIYCDLLLTQDNSEFIDWLSKFQEKVRELIIEKSDNWFHEPISLDEIEYNWNNSIRTYKSKNYLIRSFVHKNKRLNKIGLQIYDSDEKEVSLDDIDSSKDVICIIEIVGLKFSNQSFSLEICLRQIMVMNNKPIFNKCLIKTEKSKHTVTSNNKLDDNSVEPPTPSEEVEIITDNSNLEGGDVDDASTTDINLENTNTEETNIEETNIEETTLETSNVDTILDNIVDNTSNVSQNKETDIKDLPNEKDNNKSLKKNDNLEEIELKIDDTDTINIKEPNEVYLDIYKAARKSAKAKKNEAIKAYLEAKRIKELYMLDIVDSSEEEEEDEDDKELFSEN